MGNFITNQSSVPVLKADLHTRAWAQSSQVEMFPPTLSRSKKIVWNKSNQNVTDAMKKKGFSIRSKGIEFLNGSCWNSLLMHENVRCMYIFGCTMFHYVHTAVFHPDHANDAKRYYNCYYILKKNFISEWIRLNPIHISYLECQLLSAVLHSGTRSNQFNGNLMVSLFFYSLFRLPICPS